MEWLSDSLIVVLPLLAAFVEALGAPFDRSLLPLFALSLGQSLALAWCRRFPLTVLVVVICLEFLLVAEDLEVLVGCLAAATALGAWGGRLQQRLGLAFGLGLLAFAMVSKAAGGSGDTMVGLTALAVLFVGCWLFGRVGAARRRRLYELDRYSRRLRAERLVERRAAERERMLLARELHDILNHAVTAMILDADAAVATGDEAESRRTLRRVAATGRQSLAELRRLLDVLRTEHAGPENDPLTVPPGLDQVDDLARAVPEGGPRVRLERRGTPRPVDESIGRAAYRVVQESLTNVARHAGAVQVLVSLSYTADSLAVGVRNDPPAHPPPALPGGGLGLIGMRERVELVGGTLTAGPHAAGGYEVRATFPVRTAS